MKRFLMATALCAVAIPALAQTTIGGNLGNGSSANMQSGVNSAISTGNIGTGNSPTATSTSQGGMGGAGGYGGSSGGNNVTSSNTFNSNSPSTIRNTPSVALGMATAYCQNSAGAGVSAPGFSITGMFGKHDADCVRYNYALALQALGEPEAALLVMANNREVNAALTESRNRRNAVQQVAITRVVPMNPATARDPRPSRRQCEQLRRLADPTQVQRDFMWANCQ